MADEPFEESTLVEQLSSLLFVVFHDRSRDVMASTLERVVLWQPTDSDKEIIAEEYEMFRRYIASSRPEDRPSQLRTKTAASTSPRHEQA